MKLKVAQCWDDGVLNDAHLVEILRRQGAKATFNLNPGLMQEAERGEDRWLAPGETGWSCRGFRPGKLSLRDIPEVYRGFRLASHCWRHETPGSVPDADWIRSALDARHFLEDLVQEPCPGFAWPCGRTTPATVELLRENGFAYGRTTQYAADFRENTDPMALRSSCHFHASDFWDRYNAAKTAGGVFYFWGHSYEMHHYVAFWQRMEQTIRYISEDPDAEWVDVVDLVRPPAGA